MNKILLMKSMQLNLLVLSLLLTLHTSSQTILEDKFNQAACNCLSNLNYSTSKNYSDCFVQAMEINHKIVYQQCLKLYKDTSHQNVFKVAKDLYDKGSVSMIYSCKKYFLLMDTTRFSQKLKYSEDSAKKEIAILNKVDETKRDKQFYSRRGLLNFKLALLDRALNDFKKALELDNNLLEIQYFKAWVFELQMNYTEAIEIYNNLFSITKRDEFKIFTAIATRKKMGL